jgi:hypothetical protein
MLDKQAGFGSFVGLAVLALGLFSWLQGAGGWSLMLVGVLILAVTVVNWRLASKQDAQAFIPVENSAHYGYRYLKK